MDNGEIKIKNMEAKQFFLDNMSGEPLTQDSVIEGLIEFAEQNLRDRLTDYENFCLFTDKTFSCADQRIDSYLEYVKQHTK